MNKKILLIVCCLPFFGWAQNQEIATFVAYNLLNYRNETSFCTNVNNSPSAKEGYMKTIFGHIQPDIIACQEIGSNPNSAIKILDRCLNIDGETKFEMAPFSSSSGSSLSNALYYNGDMFSLKSSDKILNDNSGQALVRLIDVFTLYYNDNNLSSGSDTTFLTVFVAHLKAGNSSSDRSDRADATEALMSYIENENINGNYIMTGDFNTYTSTEVCFQNMINPSNSSIRFIDPVNRLGDWNNNGSFAEVHTQSTHSTSNGCASGGGLDDRFDFILISEDIKDDNQRIEYVKNSYQAVANDGNHFNSSINVPANTSVPANVLDAIYNNSDHLPVVMDMVLTEASPNSVRDLGKENFNLKFINPTTNGLHGEIQGAGSYGVKVFSVEGKELYHGEINLNGNKNFTLPVFAKGLVFITVVNEQGYRKTFKVIQN